MYIPQSEAIRLGYSSSPVGENTGYRDSIPNTLMTIDELYAYFDRIKSRTLNKTKTTKP